MIAHTSRTSLVILVWSSLRLSGQRVPHLQTKLNLGVLHLERALEEVLLDQRVVGLLRPPRLEHEGLEVILHHGLLRSGVPALVDHDAAEEGDLRHLLPEGGIRDADVQAALHQIPDQVVRAVGHRRHLAVPHEPRANSAAVLVVMKLALELVQDPLLLLVHGPVGGGVHPVLPRLKEGLVRADSGSARSARLGHAHALDLADDTLLGDADVGTEDDDDLAVHGAVAEEGAEAALAHERQTCEASEVEKSSLAVGQALLKLGADAVGDTVDLVGADRRAEQGVVQRVSPVLQ
mmetsp:Transcript_5304/g.11110  ORF Transcript_5304/g.11110 Transcript_5304/m.11110 type:complete len:292 (+) Transcript_5304:272-1147(+)